MALIYLNIHYIASAFGSKWFRKPTLWQRITILVADVVYVFAVLLSIILLGVIVCNSSISSRVIAVTTQQGAWAKLTGAITGSSDICSPFTALNLSSYIGGGSSTSLATPSAPVGAGASSCQPPASGPATIQALSSSCFGSNAGAAADVAMHESGGIAAQPSTVDICTLDGSVVSFGLFQINISANPIGNLKCPSAFNQMFTAQNKNCKVTNQALYQQCVAAAENPAANIAEACQLSSNGTNWGPWANTAKACGF